MKKTPHKPGNIAALTFAIGAAAGALVQLLPAGEFKPTDGRPMPFGSWKLTDKNAPKVVAQVHGRKNDFVIDYEHQTQLADINGQPAPAAGWFKRVEFDAAKGLFATDVRWTVRATEYIGADEYRYISAVFEFNPKTGEVERLICAALTNNPGLDGMDEVQLAALTARFSTADIDPASSSVDNPSENSMNPVLMALLKALGLPETDATTAEQAVSAVTMLRSAPADLRKAAGLAETVTAADAVTAVAALKAGADKAESLTTEVAALKASGAGGNPDPTKFVSLDSFNALNKEVVALKAVGVDREVDELIAAARAEGKCSPVVEKVWRDIGKVDVAQLKALIKDTPANPALAGQTQTGGKPAAALDPKAPGTAEELAMCKSMGLTLEQFRGGAEVAA